jgi:hypothetical protein
MLSILLQKDQIGKEVYTPVHYWRKYINTERHLVLERKLRRFDGFDWFNRASRNVHTNMLNYAFYPDPESLVRMRVPAIVLYQGPANGGFGLCFGPRVNPAWESRLIGSIPHSNLEMPEVIGLLRIASPLVEVPPSPPNGILEGSLAESLQPPTAICGEKDAVNALWLNLAQTIWRGARYSITGAIKSPPNDATVTPLIVRWFRQQLFAPRVAFERPSCTPARY